MAYADFGYYQDFFLGKLITDMEQFRTLSERASEYIDMVTFYRINTEFLKDKSVEKLIKKCTCAVAEAYYIYDITQPSYLRKICTKYLGCTGLMFRGVCY